MGLIADSPTNPHEITGTRRLDLWSQDAPSTVSCGDPNYAVGTAYSSRYLSDDEYGCAEIEVYVVALEDGTYGVEEMTTVGKAACEDGAWRPDDSAYIEYDWASVLVYHTEEDAQRFADYYGQQDFSWCLHLRQQCLRKDM